MTQSTDHPIRFQRGMGNPATAVLLRAARWSCACTFLAIAVVAQAQDTSLPATTVTSGSSSYTAGSSITAGASATYPGAVFIVNSGPTNSASVTFTAGSFIKLEPGFHAIAGTTATTFHAIIAPVVSDFTISLVPVTATVVAGGPATYTVTIGAVNGFAGTVSFVPSGLPGGGSAIFSPPAINGSGATTMTVNTVFGGVTGAFSVMVTGVSGTLHHAAPPVSLLVQDFTIGLSPGTPTSRTIAPTGVAGYSILVNASGGFSGTVGLTAAGLPAGAAASFNPSSVTGAGSSAFSVTTASATPLGTFPLTVTGQSGSGSHTTVVFLTVGSASAATMISPAPGSNLTSSPATFLWNPGAGASQYLFAVGSTPGGSDYYSVSLGSGANAYCLDRTFRCQSATATNIPIGSQTQNLYARLSSLVSGTWQYRDYPYQTGPAPFGEMPNNIGLGVSSFPYVNNDGHESQPWNFSLCDRTSAPGTCANTQDWNGGNVGDTCQVTFNIGGAADANVTARVTAKGTASSSRKTNSYDIAFTASPLANSGALREVTCSYGANPMNPLTFIVYDATPQIGYVQQLQPLYPGGQAWITLWGTNFGASIGTVKVLIPGATFDSGISAAVVPPYGVWIDALLVDTQTFSYGQVNVLLTASPSVAVGPYDVQVVSRGTGASGFAAGPTSQSSSQIYGAGPGQQHPVTVSSPQQFTISGRVTANGKPIPGLVIGVVINGSGRPSVPTQQDGSYLISVVEGDNVGIGPSYSPYQLTFNTPPNPGSIAQCVNQYPTTCSFINIRGNQPRISRRHTLPCSCSMASYKVPKPCRASRRT